MRPFPKGVFRDPEVPPCYSVEIRRTSNDTVYTLLDEHGWVKAQVTATNYTDEILIAFQPSREDVIRAFKLLVPAGSTLDTTRPERREGHPVH